MTTTAHTKCHACGARLFSVTFTAGVATSFSSEPNVAVVFDANDECLALCPLCGDTTHAPFMKAVITHLEAQARVH